MKSGIGRSYWGFTLPVSMEVIGFPWIVQKGPLFISKKKDDFFRLFEDNWFGRLKKPEIQLKIEDNTKLNENASVNSFNREEGSASSCDVHSAEEEKQSTIEEDQTKLLNENPSTLATGMMATITIVSTEEQGSRINNIKLGKYGALNIISNITNDTRDITFQDLHKDLARDLGFSIHQLQFKTMHQLMKISEGKVHVTYCEVAQDLG